MREHALNAHSQANNRLDKWLQRAAVAAMVSVAVTLVAIGIVLYGRPLQIGNPVAVETDKVTTLESVAAAAAK